MPPNTTPYDEISRDAVRSAVAAILLERGRPIAMIEAARGRTYPGDGRQAQYHDSPIWHTKRDLDSMVAGRLNLDADALLGPERKSSDFSSHTAKIISELRHKGMLQDWNTGRQFGIWRVADAPRLSAYRDQCARTAERYRPAEPDAGAAAPDLNRAFLSILDHGSKDNTYKFALARALLDHCRDHADASDNPLEVPYVYFADKFMRYYFHQEYKFRIRQNFHPERPPRAISILHATFGATAPGEIDLLEKDSVEKARRRFLTGIFGHARSKTSLVIPRFQNVRGYPSGGLGGVFYEYDDDAQVLTLRPEAFAFLRRNHAVLSKAVLAEWAKFLERINPSLPMLVAKIERDEATRGQLAGYRRLYLRHWCHCFYCGDRLERGHIHVDHLIPWSYLFDDNAWNLVLACQDCNLKKGGSLPQEEFRDDLIERNRRHYGLVGEIRSSLDMLDSGRGWEPEIVERYKRCRECGFGIMSMPRRGPGPRRRPKDGMLWP